MLAGMVYILGIVPVDASVDVTVSVQFTNAFPSGSPHSVHGLSTTNSFASVFGYGAAFRKADSRKTAEAVDRRLHDG